MNSPRLSPRTVVKHMTATGRIIFYDWLNVCVGTGARLVEVYATQKHLHVAATPAAQSAWNGQRIMTGPTNMLDDDWLRLLLALNKTCAERGFTGHANITVKVPDGPLHTYEEHQSLPTADNLIRWHLQHPKNQFNGQALCFDQLRACLTPVTF